MGFRVNISIAPKEFKTVWITRKDSLFELFLNGGLTIDPPIWFHINAADERKTQRTLKVS